MSVTPPATGSGWMSRKVLGVPVLYLALGFVLILAVFAWRMKGSAGTAPAADQTPPESAGDTILSEQSNALPPLPLGTVYAGPGQSVSGSDPNLSGNSAITTNDDWLRKGVMLLADRGVSPGAAQLGLSQYLDGNEVTFEQGQWRDAVIREYGVPPYPVNIGPTTPDVARKQGPLPRTHVVKSTSEDTVGELAQLYYNRTDAFAVKAITDANGGQATWNVGDSVTVPVLPTPSIVAPPVTTAPPAPAPTPIAKPPVVTKPVAKPVRKYTIKRGDTLSGIALRYYGSASKASYMKIANANGIKDPNRIYAGSTITIPY